MPSRDVLVDCFGGSLTIQCQECSTGRIDRHARRGRLLVSESTESTSASTLFRELAVWPMTGQHRCLGLACDLSQLRRWFSCGLVTCLKQRRVEDRPNAVRPSRPLPNGRRGPNLLVDRERFIGLKGYRSSSVKSRHGASFMAFVKMVLWRAV